jgi:hypothetical protein
MNGAKVVLILGVLVFIAYTTEKDRSWKYRLSKEDEERKLRRQQSKQRAS